MAGLKDLLEGLLGPVLFGRSGGPLAQQGGFSIPDPQSAPPPPPVATAPPAETASRTADAAGSGSGDNPFSGLGDSFNSLSQTDYVIIAGVMLVMAVIFYFVRGGIKNGLLRAKATPSSARGAGWAWYAFAMVATLVVTSGIVGNVWTNLYFAGVGVVLMLVVMILALIMTMQALAKH